MRLIWNALGLYVNRNLRMGRGVNVPKLGIFTLTPPEVVLKVSLLLTYHRVLPMKPIATNARVLQSF